MHFSVSSLAQRVRFTIAVAAMLVSAAALSGCVTTNGSSSALSGPLVGGKTEKLSYGVTVPVPHDWAIVNSVTENKMSKQEIDATVASGGRTQLLEMKRTDGDGKTTAAVYVYIVNSKRDMMPEEAVVSATPEFYQQLAHTVIQSAKDEAAKHKQESNMLEWHISGLSVSGKTGVLQMGLGKRPGGAMRVLNADLYLPNNAGLVVKLMGYPEVAGTDELLRAILQQIEIVD